VNPGRFCLDRRMSPQDVVTSFLHGYGKRVKTRYYRQMLKNFRQPTTSESAKIFREVLFEHVGFAFKPFGQIHRDMVDDWGECGLRRVWRHLRRLMSDGLVERTSDGYRRVRS
jgi:hypothetical protein